MAKVIFIAGLPGSGKSTFVKQNYSKNKYEVYDDYKNKAMNNCSKFEYSQHYKKLIHNLNSGQDCVVADIDFCRAESRDEANRFIKEFSPAAVSQWIFFENNPEACNRLLNYLHETTGKNIADKLKMLNRYKALYKIPIGVNPVPIWRPPGNE